MKQIIVLAAWLVSIVAVAQDRNENNNPLAAIPLQKLILAEARINQLYVEDVDEDKLVEDAIRGMLNQLDPHSAYTPAKEVKALTEPLEGNFEGIGVQYNMVEDTLVVIQPVSGGPSEKVGIIAGDRIITVNDTSIAGQKLTTDDIKRKLRGPKGSKVRLGVMRQGVKGLNTFIVTRDTIPVYSIDAKYMIDETTGYIRINNFGAKTHEEFKSAVRMLQDHGMQDMVLDLQGNGGGYLEAAVRISNEFLEKGDLIVFTEGRIMPRQNFLADGNGVFRKGRVVVLIDSYTASASEIVSGAIQDHDRGLVIGRRSFGKGLVQRAINMPDGSMIRLTTAHYYSPSGRCIQKPYVKGKGDDYNKDMLERLNSGELTNPDSIHFADSLKFKTLKNQRTVYGGGGIMPDVYVTLDTAQYTRFHRELLAKSCIPQACLKFIDKNRKKLLRQYSTFDSFNQNYEITQELMDMLLDNAKKAKVEYNDSILEKSLLMLKLQMKALLARDLWEMNEYYQISNGSNNIYLKGIATIKRDDYEDLLSK